MERNKGETKKTYTRLYTISYYSFHQKEKTNTKASQQEHYTTQADTPTRITKSNTSATERDFLGDIHEQQIRDKDNSKL